jgi:hypothetical protein
VMSDRSKETWMLFVSHRPTLSPDAQVVA